MFVQEEHVGEARCLRGGYKVRQNEVSSVQANGGREEKANLFGEGGEAGRGVSGSGDENPGVDDTGKLGILIVEIKSFACREVGSGFIVLEVFAQLLIVGDGWVEGLA